MRKDDHLIYEAFQDNLTKTKQALGQNIMRIVKHGVPGEKDVPVIKQELANIFTTAKKANNKFTPEQESRAKELIAKLRNSGMPENELRDIYRNAPVDNSNAQDYTKEMEKDYTSQKIGSEAAEDMSKSPFHYDPMHGLASAAHQIKDILKSTANDEARPEHIEKMAEIILGPQSEYASVDQYEKALSGVIELLNHYVVVSMNEYEEMPSKDFNKLKQHINKGPIQIKKPSKELPNTHKYIHHLAKQDSREDQKEENAEGSICIEDLATKHGVSLEHMQDQLGMGLKVEMEHTKDMDVAKKIALDHLNEDPDYYTKLAKMEGQSENEERRLDPKCWKGYHKQGTKLKDGKRVNNCVKNS